MQVSVESTGALERRMRVDVPEDQIEGEIKTRLQSLTKTARVDGFRKGKVPVRIIQQRYGEQVRFEVLGEVMRKTYVEALQAEKLNPAGDPVIEQNESDDKDAKGLSYTAVFEIFPEVTLNPVEKLSVTIPTCELEDADVEQMVETLQSQQSSWNEVDRKAAADDQLIIDFAGYMNDEAFEGGAAEDFELKLGSGSLIDGFEDGLIGASSGDSITLNLEFPTPYQNEELAGKPVRFEVTVKTVSEAVLPELNDEFFERFGVTKGGLDAFKVNIRENMERESEQRVKNQAKGKVLTALYDGNPFEIPKSLIASESEQIMESSKQRYTQQGLPEEQLNSLNIGMFEDEAKRRVALGLLMSDIIKENDIKADAGKVRETVEKIGASYEDTAAVTDWYYADQSRLADIQNMVLEEEVVSWILEKAQVTKESVAFDTLMNPESN